MHSVITLGRFTSGLLVLALTALPLQAAEMRRQGCDDKFLDNQYFLLIQQELAIGEAFNKMVRTSGTPQLTNCVVEYPMDGGEAGWGLRRVVMDKQWYTTVKDTSGAQKRIFQQHGLEVRYDLQPDGRGGQKRTVVSLRVCRTPETCTEFGIPVQTDATPVRQEPIPEGR